MQNIVLLMCGNNKEKYKTKAKNLYKSSRFQKSLQYAKILTKENNIFILSAKHGLLELEMEIEPYDKSIYDMSIIEKNEWAKKVISQLRKKVNIENDKFILLADDFYGEYLLEYLPHVELPLSGLDQSEHLFWFNKMLNKKEG